MNPTQKRLAKAITLAMITAGASNTWAQPLDLSLLGDQGIRFDGLNVGDEAGQAVSGVGDVNGDGIPDAIVSALGVNRAAGEAYVVFGRKESDVIDLGDIRTDGFALNRTFEGDLAGYSASGAGDVNGDGLDDVIVGALGSAGYTGRAVVVFGKTGSRPVDITDIDTNGFVIQDNLIGGRLGTSVSGVGDFNGDGLDDIVVGQPYASYTPLNQPTRNRTGSAYVIFGKDNSRPVDLGALGEEGTTIVGVTIDHRLGHRVSGAGDVNGDGLADVLISTRFGNRSYLVFGQPVATTINLSSSGLKGFEIIGDSEHSSVSGAGDVNGDGLADIVIGQRLVNSQQGKAHVIFGKRSPDDVLLNTLGNGGFVINSAVAGGLLGQSVAGAGDVNGDGLADLIIGAPGASYTNTTANGVAYLVYGKSSSTDIDLSIPGNSHRYLFGGALGDSAGRAVGGTGDVNDDGLADILVGASLADPNLNLSAGSAYLVFAPGPPTNPTPTYRTRSGPGDTPRMAIGASGNRSNHTTPDSRVWMDFTAGQGAVFSSSLQTVTLHRVGSPLPAAGADVYWEISSDRFNFGAVGIAFRYLESEVLAASEEDLRLFTSTLVDGPYTEIPATVDSQRNTLSTTVNQLGYFFIGQGPRSDALFADSFEQ
ncbi:MAG: hypothetical protein AB8B96_05145 [Lysobacterales bacterium]